METAEIKLLLWLFTLRSSTVLGSGEASYIVSTSFGQGLLMFISPHNFDKNSDRCMKWLCLNFSSTWAGLEC